MSSPKTRVLFVINDLRRAGAETQLVRLAGALDPNDYEPRILLLKARNEFASELARMAIPAAALQRHGPLDPRTAFRLYRHLRRDRPQLVHTSLALAELLTVPAARGAGVGRLVVAQRSSYEATLGPVQRRAVRIAHRHADHVIVNSQATLREELAAGVPADRISCIPNGIATGAPILDCDRAGLGLPGGPLVVALGQLVPEKGHHGLLTAWAEVQRRRPDARLAVVGEGSLRDELEAHCRSLGLSGSVLFLGFRHPAEPYLACADIVTLASLTEGMPNAILEAMACARPVVATSVGGVPELVADGESGFVVPPREPARLADALLRLLEDPSLRARFGAAGRRRVEGSFSLERMVTATEAVYQLVLSRSASRAASLRKAPLA